MARGIMILGPSGAGKTTLGKLVASKMNVAFVDVDEYIWRQDTEKPFTAMYSKVEKISRLMEAISNVDYFIMAGSMNSFHEHFDPFFDLVVLLTADVNLRVERVHKRELGWFGSRVLEGGDMYDEHQKYLVDIAGYDIGKGSTTMEEHKKWIDSLSCKVIQLDGGLDLEQNANAIIEEYNECLCLN